MPTAAAPVLASWFYQNLPLFSFVLHSFLPYCIRDDLRYMHFGFGERLYLSAVQAGALLHYSLHGMFEELEAKRSIMIHRVYRDTPTFISITGACALTIVHSLLSEMPGLIVEMLLVFSIYNTVQSPPQHTQNNR